MLTKLLYIAALFVALTQPAAGQAPCRDRVVIAPPPVNDRPLAAWLSTEVTSYLSQLARKRCWTIVDLEKTSATFDIVGATTGFPIAPGDYRGKQISYIAERHNATHILFMDAPDANGNLHLKLMLIRDQTRLVPVRTYSLRLDPDAVDAQRTKFLPRALTKLAPNSVTVGFSDTDVYFNVDKDHFSERGQTNRGVLPPLLSSVTLSRVDHRRGYGLFDVSGSILPATYFFGINQDNRFGRNPGLPDADLYPEDLSMHIETYGAAGSINAQGSLFTPIGTTYIGIGWGPALLWLQKQDRRAGLYLNAATRLYFGHRVFISDRLFVAVDWDSLLFNKALYKTQFASASQVERSSFTFGWYVEDSERLASSMWDSLLSAF